MRSINVDGESWGFFIGKNNVVILDPRSEKKMIITLERLTGKTQEIITSGRKNKSKDGMITPAILKSFILTNFPKPKEEE